MTNIFLYDMTAESTPHLQIVFLNNLSSFGTAEIRKVSNELTVKVKNVALNLIKYN